MEAGWRRIMSQSRKRSGRTASTAPPAPHAQVTQFLEEFDAFLATVRGLAGGTRRKYGRFVKHFLDGRTSGAPLEWQQPSADTLRTYARRELSSTVRRPSNAPFVALRAMLRFLVFKELSAPGLEGAIPRIRRWRHAALPACLSTEEVSPCRGRERAHETRRTGKSAYAIP